MHLRVLAAVSLFSAVPSALAASTNYKALLDNDDGSVTIVEPAFLAGTKGNLPISATSNLFGLCRFFGFGPFVQGGLRVSADSETKVLIEGGRFSGFVRDVFTVSSLACENSLAPGPSRRASRIVRSDDGSFLVVEPKFGFIGGREMPISSASDMDGVCKLYGLGVYVRLSRTLSDSTVEAALINHLGRYEGFTEHRHVGLSSLMCDPGPLTSPPEAPAGEHGGASADETATPAPALEPAPPAEERPREPVYDDEF